MKNIDWNRQLRIKIKMFLRKYLGTDFNLDGVIIGKDFKDQAKLLSQEEVKVIFDIGANHGQSTFKYRKIFPEAAIYAFEPFKDSYEYYKKTFIWDQKVKSYNFAVANKNGESTLYLNQCHYANSLLKSEKISDRLFHDNDYHLKTIDKVKVQTVKLDTFVKTQGLSKIDILKVDVQGGEMEVLKGAEDLLNHQKINLLFIEVEFARQYQGQPLFYNICSYLASRKYSFFNFSQIGSSINGQAISTDAIFLSHKMQEKYIDHLK